MECKTSSNGQKAWFIIDSLEEEEILQSGTYLKLESLYKTEIYIRIAPSIIRAYFENAIARKLYKKREHTPFEIDLNPCVECGSTPYLDISPDLKWDYIVCPSQTCKNVRVSSKHNDTEIGNKWNLLQTELANIETTQEEE